MRKFIIKLLTFSLMIIIIDVIIISILEKQSYLKAIILKHDLLKKAGPNKIVFIGGSNLSFGMDSEKIYKAFKRKTVNMGLYGNFGLLFMLNEVKDNIKKNDTIIIIPEYRNFFNQTIHGKQDMAEVVFIYPGAVKYLTSFKQWKIFLPGSITVLQRKIQARAELLFRDKFRWEIAREKLYSKEKFNGYGDMTGHWYLGYGQGKGSRFFFRENQFNKDSIKILNDFNKYVTNKGARVLFVYPAISEVVYNRNRKTLNFLHIKLTESLNFPVISSPARYVLPHKGNFYDTIYHLSRRGINKRMKLLIEDLSPYFK